MIRPLLLTLLMLLASAGAACAAEQAKSEDEMVRLCSRELEDRLFAGGAHGEAFVTARNIEHQPDRIVVRLGLASGEGRAVAGSCIFRDGKLFDVK